MSCRKMVVGREKNRRVGFEWQKMRILQDIKTLLDEFARYVKCHTVNAILQLFLNE